MRKLLLIGTMVFACLFANAQDGLKGTWFAGGAFKFQSIDHEGAGVETGDTYSITPLLGKFVSPSVAVGGAIGYTHYKLGDAKTNTISVMPLVRKYWNVTGGLYFFGQAALPIDFVNTKDVADGFGLGVNLSPGFDLIVTSWLTVEASFTLASFSYLSTSPKEGDSTNSWSFNGNGIGASKFGDLSVGVKFLF